MNIYDNINKFITIFNEIDKYFDKIIHKTDKFMPYNEKIKVLSQGGYHISNFIKQYQDKLKFLGMIRNHIAHGNGLDGHTYSIPTNYSIEEISKFRDAIKKPMTCFEVFKRDIFTCTTDDILYSIVKIMRDNLYTHIPVYDNGTFIGMLTESTITYRGADYLSEGNSIGPTTKIKDVNLSNPNEVYIFINKKKTIYEIELDYSQFAKTYQNAASSKKFKRLGAVFITKNGLPSEKIEGIITAIDIPTINDHFFI